MSSILDALRELERGEGPDAESAAAPAVGSSSLRRFAPWVLLGLVACVALGMGLGGRGVPDEARAPESGERESQLPPAAPARPLPDALRTAAPRGDVMPRTVTPTVAPAMVASASTKSAPPAAAAPAPPRASGEPLVHLRSVRFSSIAEDRAAALAINGGSAVTLHEGESAEGVEVQLITPDRVYVRHGGSIFAVRPRD
jgi:hypothetical protein